MERNGAGGGRTLKVFRPADFKFCPHFGGENALFEQQTRLFWASLGTSLLLTIVGPVCRSHKWRKPYV